MIRTGNALLRDKHRGILANCLNENSNDKTTALKDMGMVPGPISREV